MSKNTRKNTLFFLVAVGLAIFAGFRLTNTSYAGQSGDYEAAWMTDYEAAMAKAKADDKPVLLEFTGSDWCPPCMQLHANVLTQKAFKDYSDENLVLVKLDYPKRKEQSEEVKAQNQKLAGQYGIRGFPTVIVLSPEGKELTRWVGYNRESPEEYVANLKQVVSGEAS